MRFKLDEHRGASGPGRVALTSRNVATIVGTAAAAVIAVGVIMPSFLHPSQGAGSAGRATTSISPETTTRGSSDRPSLTTAPATALGVGNGNAFGENGVTARGGPGKVLVSWQLPTDPGNDVTTTIRGSDGSRPASTCVPNATGCTVDKLTNGVEYTVRVTLRRKGKVVSEQSVSAIPFPAVLAGRSNRLWLDPVSPGSLVSADGGTPRVGGRIQRLLDRSPSRADASARIGYVMPTYTVMNGHPALAFSAAAGLAFSAASLPIGDSPSTVYAVAALEDENAGSSCFTILLSWGAKRAGGLRSLIKGCNTAMAFADTFDTWSLARPTRAWQLDRPQIMRADFTADALSVWMNGSPSYVWKQAKGTMDTGSGAEGMLGAVQWDQMSGWRGNTAEVIVLSAVPTPAENAAILEYLKHKWGV